MTYPVVAVAPGLTGLLHSAGGAITGNLPAPVLEVVSRLGYHPDALMLTGSAAGGYAVARTIGGFLTNAMYSSYEDKTLKNSPVAVEPHERTGRFFNALGNFLTVGSLGVIAATGIPGGVESSEYGMAVLMGAGMYLPEFLATGAGVLLSSITKKPTLEDGMRLTTDVKYQSKGRSGLTWQLEDFFDRSSVSVENQAFILADPTLPETLRMASQTAPNSIKLFMEKVLMRAVNPDMPEAYRINLLRLIARYVKVLDSRGDPVNILMDDRLLGLLVTGSANIKTAAHGVYVENLSHNLAGATMTKGLSEKLATFYHEHRADKNGLAVELVRLHQVVRVLLDTDAPLSREEFFTRVENAAADGADLTAAFNGAFHGKNARTYVGYIDQIYRSLAAGSPEKTGEAQLKDLKFLRLLFTTFNAPGNEKPFSPVAALKAALPYIVAQNEDVRAEAIKLQEEQAKYLILQEKKQWHMALVQVLKSDDRRGLMKQPAPIKIEVLQFMARMAPVFNDIDNHADYDYTASYLFDVDPNVREETAKTHLGILRANPDAKEEKFYLDVLIARVVKVAKKGEPSEREKLRLERFLNAMNTVFPALSDEGKKRVIRVLNTIEWGFVSRQFEPLAEMIEHDAYNRVIFDPDGRVLAVKAAFAKFLSLEVPVVADIDESVEPASQTDSDGEVLTKSLLDMKPEEIFAYVQEKVVNAAKTMTKPVPLTVAVAGTALLAFGTYKFIQYSRTDNGRAKILKAPGGASVISFIDTYMPEGVTLGAWTRSGILQLPYGAKFLGLVGTHVPFLANWATPPDMVQAAAETVLAPFVPTRAELEKAVDAAFAETPAIPVVQAKPDTNGEGGGDGDQAQASVAEVPAAEGAAKEAVVAAIPEAPVAVESPAIVSVTAAVEAPAAVVAETSVAATSGDGSGS